MDMCDGKPIDIWQAVDAGQNVSHIFQEIKQANLLPSTAKIYTEHGAFGVMGIDYNGDLTVMSLSLACMTHDEIKAVMLHEVGHYNYHDIEGDFIALGTQALVLTAFACAAVYNTARYALRRRWPYDKARFRMPLLQGMIVLQTLLGVAFATSDEKRESRADLFSARQMNSGDPLISALRKIEYFDDNYNVGAIEDTLWTVHYGVLGAHHTHPPLAKRIAALRAYRPEPATHVLQKADKLNVN